MQVTAKTFQRSPLPSVSPASALLHHRIHLPKVLLCFSRRRRDLFDLTPCTSLSVFNSKLSLTPPFLYLSSFFLMPSREPIFFCFSYKSFLIISSPVITFIYLFNQPTGFVSVPPAYETGLGEMSDIWEVSARIRGQVRNL